MEQIIAVFGINWKLLLIQGINFALVLFVLHRFLYRPILKMIDARREKLETGVKEADEAHVKLENAEKDAHGIISKAEREAQETAISAKRAAEEKADALRKETEDKNARALKEAAREAEEMKKRAIEESQNEIAKLSILAAEKVLKTK